MNRMMQTRMAFCLFGFVLFAVIGCKDRTASTPEILVIDDEQQGAGMFDARSLAPLIQPTAPQPIGFRPSGESKRLEKEAAKNVKVPIGGTVQDWDGKPAAGSTVVVTSWDKILASAKVDENGAFSLGDVEIPILPATNFRALPVGSVRIVSVASNKCVSSPFIAHYFDVDRPANPMPQGYYHGDSLQVNLKHHKTGMVRYQLQDDMGQPIAGARVYLVQLVGPGINEWDYEGWHHPALETTTDANGRLEFANVPPKGFARFRVEARGFAATEVFGYAQPPEQTNIATAWGIPQRGDTWIVKLPKPVPMKFQITSKKSGRPIEGADVTAEKPSTNSEPMRAEATARSDANGFAVLMLPPGTYNVAASVDNQSVNRMYAENMNLAPDKTIEYQLASVYNISIEALDVESRKPIAGVKVSFHYKHATAINVGRGPDVRATTTGKAILGPTGADGRYFWGRPDLKLFGLGGSPTLQEMRFEVIESPGYVPVGIPDPRWDPGSGKQTLFRFMFRKSP